ncbi:MAG: hypothetical protein ABL871_16435, partial [Terricaulis sp.]
MALVWLLMPDFFHPQMLPATIGAVIGLPLFVLACVWLFRRWGKFGARKRGALFAVFALFGAAYGLNIYAWFIEPQMLVVRRVEVVSEQWHGAPL